ncbi:MAG: hypothetical protein ACFFKA_11475, partial [Candidatus Thorarchaeota archaeon]
ERDRVYYTICEYRNATEIRCDIYYRDYQDGKFSEPVKLPGIINDSSLGIKGKTELSQGIEINI